MKFILYILNSNEYTTGFDYIQIVTFDAVTIDELIFVSRKCGPNAVFSIGRGRDETFRTTWVKSLLLLFVK